MARTQIVTADAPRPGGGYSQGIAAGGLVFTAGFGPHDPKTGAVVGSDIAGQTRQALANVAAVLATAGLGLADVAKATVHLADLGDFAAFDAVYRELMPEPRPARTTVGSVLAGILVEIDVVAVRS